MTRVRRLAVAFARFWQDFLFGDAPEIFVGVLVILAVVIPLRHHEVLAGALLLGMVTLVLFASLFRARVRG